MAAIDVGYRHFHCASAYQTETEIRDVLQEKIEEETVRREGLFIIIKAMEERVDAGMGKAVGVFSLNCKQIDLLLSKPDLRHKPENNQIESHLYLPREKLIKFCQSKGISVTACCPLERPAGHGPSLKIISLFDDP